MADTNVENTSEKSSERPKAADKFTLNIPTTDKSCEVAAQVEVYDDPAQLPHLIEITDDRPDKSKPTSTLSLPDPQDVVTYIIISTGSGHQKATTFFDSILAPILAAVYKRGLTNAKMHTTDSESSILNLARFTLFPKANAGIKQVVILLSGDGGIVDLVNGLLAKSPTAEYVAPCVMLFPLGTANALFHSLDPGPSTKWGLDALNSKNTLPLPVFTANFSPGARLLVDQARDTQELVKDRHGQNVLYGAVVCSWGMHASLVADSDTTEYRKFGIGRFKKSAEEALFPSDGSAPHAYKGKVSILKGQTWDNFPQKEHMYVLGTMVSRLESTFTISPASQPLDGRMHLVYFEPKSGKEATRMMELAYDGGKHVDDPAVRYEAIDGLKIEFDEEDERWRRVCVDGKIVVVEQGGWVKVFKRKGSVVDIIIPDKERRRH